MSLHSHDVFHMTVLRTNTCSKLPVHNVLVNTAADLYLRKPRTATIYSHSVIEVHKSSGQAVIDRDKSSRPLIAVDNLSGRLMDFDNYMWINIGGSRLPYVSAAVSVHQRCGWLSIIKQLHGRW